MREEEERRGEEEERRGEEGENTSPDSVRERTDRRVGRESPTSALHEIESVVKALEAASSCSRQSSHH
jgi:hypothetical protein